MLCEEDHREGSHHSHDENSSTLGSCSWYLDPNKKNCLVKIMSYDLVRKGESLGKAFEDSIIWHNSHVSLFSVSCCQSRCHYQLLICSAIIDSNPLNQFIACFHIIALIIVFYHSNRKVSKIMEMGIHSQKENTIEIAEQTRNEYKAKNPEDGTGYIKS